MKVSDYIVSFLEAHGVEYVFGYQGGMITHLVDSLSKSRRVKFVQCYHEHSAAFAAEGYARASGRFGVCMTTSGPGATNVVTSVGDAFFDSIPVLFITGQVNTYEYKYDLKVRQRGFQETDIVSIVRPISKWAKLVDDPGELIEDLEKAVRVIMSGRKGPVLLDIPMDVQRAETTPAKVCRPSEGWPASACDTEAAERAIDVLRKARRPLVLCGGGLSTTAAGNAARDFIRRTRIPFAVTLMGKGSLPEDDGFFVGMIGCYGNRSANCVLSESDVVLCLGARLDARQIGNRKSPVLKNITFIRVDVDGNELELDPLPRQLGICADVLSFLGYDAVLKTGVTASEQWRARVAEISRIRSQAEDVKKFVSNKVPYEVLEEISRIAGRDAVFVADVGQNQMWAAQMLKMFGRRRFFTGGGMASMGYAMPVAVGAAFADPDRQIICICGDGGFHMATQSLMLIAQYGLKVSVVVLNNEALGMITQFQSLYFSGNMAGTTKEKGYLVPDVGHMAAAYKIPFRRITVASEIKAEFLDGPSLIEVDTGGLTTVVPKLEFNKSLADMTPAWPLTEEPCK